MYFYLVDNVNIALTGQVQFLSLIKIKPQLSRLIFFLSLTHSPPPSMLFYLAFLYSIPDKNMRVHISSQQKLIATPFHYYCPYLWSTQEWSV